MRLTSRSIRSMLYVAATAFVMFCAGSRCQAATSYGVPENSGFKSYMSYKAIGDGKSKQAQLQRKATTGDLGIRTVDDRYCVSVGSYFNAEVGTPIDVTLDTGTVLKCIVGDRKQDVHTDSELHYKAPSNGNVVEFIVDVDSMPKEAKRAGSLHVLSGFEGTVVNVVVHSDNEPEITNAVKQVNKVESVTLADENLTVAHYDSTSNIDCLYASAEQAKDICEEFVTYTPIDGMVVGN